MSGRCRLVAASPAIRLAPAAACSETLEATDALPVGDGGGVGVQLDAGGVEVVLDDVGAEGRLGDLALGEQVGCVAQAGRHPGLVRVVSVAGERGPERQLVLDAMEPAGDQR